ncbi:hypothetical protein BUALT_Bualt02G0082100 [Buddleja alternifolia]|uniref:peptidylprolyl isomerase n=1 Tax=Buddleja alternifolia TaxID=168488 RepID=A0AAV6Y026_9LAMI|nr:hypothetical protein BUALT_Bualt02G0082100 [Buddleja alternifolia]
MASFFVSPQFLSHPVSAKSNNYFSSSQTPPPNQPASQPQTAAPTQQLSQNSPPSPPPAAAANATGQRPSKAAASKTTVDSTDSIASSLTRRFGIGAGLAWVGFLAVGVVSEQIKTRLEVSQQEANTRYVILSRAPLTSSSSQFMHPTPNPILHIAAPGTVAPPLTYEGDPILGGWSSGAAISGSDVLFKRWRVNGGAVALWLVVIWRGGPMGDIEKEEEVVLPNGIRFYELRVGGGATPRPRDLVVMNVKGSVQGSGEVFVDTFEGEKKKPLALVLGSRPYSKGICEGIEYVLRSMKAGGKRRVIIPSNLGFGEEGADLGEGVQIPPFATLEYVIEVDRVSIAPA